MIIDVSDLENPVLHHIHVHETEAIDHNNYVHDGFVYQSNYAAGLRVLDVSEIADKKLTEVAFFDTYPAHTDATFDGTWSNYPFFESGTVAVSGRDEGLFLVKVRDEVRNPGQRTPLEIACDNCPVEIRAGESGTATLVVTGASEVDITDVPDDWAATAGAVSGDRSDVEVSVPNNAKAGTYELTATVTRGDESTSAPVVVEVRKGQPSDRGPKG